MNQDRNLLFGVLAVQLRFLTPQKLMEAAAAWATHQNEPLRKFLIASGALSEKRCEMIDGLIDEQIQAHQGDVHATLMSLGGKRAVHESFAASLVVEEDQVKLASFGGDTPREKVEAAEELEDSRNLTLAHPNRYALRGEQGRGGIGRVLIAFDQHIGREIAVKELLPEKGPDGTPSSDSPVRKTGAVAARFLREARITGQLEHPGIVPVYELGRRPDGSVYYTMKLVRGKTLAEKIGACRSLGERLQLLHHFLDLCQAMAYAHSRGVIHRDLKPANVMVGEFGETVVLDWGLAKVEGQKDVRADALERDLKQIKQAGAGETVAGKPIGTPAYMSPEQADGRIEEIDERSDVWSLGAVLYEILTGRPPYEGVNAYEVMGKVLQNPVVPVKEVEPKAPGELSAISEKCLSKERGKRYASAKELTDDVAKFLAGGLVGAFEYPIWRLLGRWFKQHGRQLALAAASVIGGLVLIGWVYATVVFHFHGDIKISPETIAAFDLAAEDARLAKLLTLPTGPGNAAEDLWESSHHVMVGGKHLGRSALPLALTEAIAWDQEKRDITWDRLKSEQPEERKKLREWSHLPEVEVFRKAAGKAGFQMMGAEYFPEPGYSFMEMPIPYYLDYLRFTGLGMVRARELEEQGKSNEAVAWYHDLMRIGNLLERDISLGELVGINIKLHTAEELAEFYDRQGQKELAEQWRQYLAVLKQRKEGGFHDYFTNGPKFSEEDLKKIVDDPKVSPGMRAESYYAVLGRMCYSSPRRFFFGPSPADRAWLFGDHFDRPELKIHQWIADIEVEGGFSRRMATGAKGVWYLTGASQKFQKAIEQLRIKWDAVFSST